MKSQRRCALPVETLEQLRGVLTPLNRLTKDTWLCQSFKKKVDIMLWYGLCALLTMLMGGFQIAIMLVTLILQNVGKLSSRKSHLEDDGPANRVKFVLRPRTRTGLGKAPKRNGCKIPYRNSHCEANLKILMWSNHQSI